MSNRTPHRDLQARYSAALRLPMNRTLSDRLVSTLTDPAALDPTGEIIEALSTRGVAGRVHVATCPWCPAVFAYLPESGDDPDEWMNMHDQRAHRGRRR